MPEPAPPADPAFVELAGRAAVAAGTTALGFFGSAVDTQAKNGPADLVSSADHRAEAAAVDVITAEAPGDHYLGEEGSRGETAGEGRRTWVIDAIDGTFNFLHEISYWCSAIAVSDEYGIAASAVYEPVAGRLFMAGRGRGATCDGAAIAPLGAGSLASLSLATYLHPDSFTDPELAEPLRRALAACGTVRITGSGSLDLCHVALGRLGLWLQHDVSPWDWQPGALLVQEAGGGLGRRLVHGHEWLAAGRSPAVGEALSSLEA